MADNEDDETLDMKAPDGFFNDDIIDAADWLVRENQKHYEFWSTLRVAHKGAMYTRVEWFKC